MATVKEALDATNVTAGKVSELIALVIAFRTKLEELKAAGTLSVADQAIVDEIISTLNATNTNVQSELDTPIV